jgi:hypothetical protein
MKTLLLTVLAVGFLGTGCIIVPGSSSRSAARAERSEKKCPQGHVWSDGQCHAKGKGHDR